jgi:hypothetical protein
MRLIQTLTHLQGRLSASVSLLTVDNDLSKCQARLIALENEPSRLNGGTCKPGRKITPALDSLESQSFACEYFMVMCTGYLALRYADRYGKGSWIKLASQRYGGGGVADG